MKTHLMVVLAILGLSGPALAGGPIAVAEDPAPLAPALVAETHDWSGPYVGLSYGRTSGDVYFSTDQFLDLENGSIGGFHAGYLWQRGNLV